MNDFEKQLSDVLQATTPEPPKAYAFTPRAEVESDAVVPIELDVVRARRRPRAGAWLAAAAVVVLGAGIAVAAVSADRSDTAPAAPDRSTAPPSAVRVCDSGDLTISQDESSSDATPVVARVIFTNGSTRTCRLPAVPDLAVTTGDAVAPSSVEDFPVAFPTAAELVLPPGGRLVFRGELATVGPCRELRDGEKATASIRVDTKDGFTLSPALGVTGCRLLPIGLRVETSR